MIYFFQCKKNRNTNTETDSVYGYYHYLLKIKLYLSWFVQPVTDLTERKNLQVYRVIVIFSQNRILVCPSIKTCLEIYNPVPASLYSSSYVTSTSLYGVHVILTLVGSSTIILGWGVSGAVEKEMKIATERAASDRITAGVRWKMSTLIVENVVYSTTVSLTLSGTTEWNINALVHSGVNSIVIVLLFLFLQKTL